MFSKTARPYDASAVPSAKRLRRNLVDLYASKELSATRAQELIDDAADAGVEDCQSLRRRSRATTTSNKKNCARDLLARLLRGCRWPRTYEAQIRTWNPRRSQEVVTIVHMFLLHEVAHVLHNHLNADSLWDRSGLDALTREHTESCERKARCSLLPMGLWGDGAPCNWDRSESLEVLALNLPGPSGDLKRLRLPLTGVSSKNVSTNTFADVLGIVAWSFQCLASGQFPSHRHDGAPLDSKRAKMPGQTLGVQGVLAEVRGDWKFMKDTFGFPSWNTNSGVCWLCDCTPQTLRDVGNDAPWSVNRRSHWELLAATRSAPFLEHPGCGPVVPGSIGCNALTKVWLRTSWAVSSFTSSRGPTCLERTDENGAALSGSGSKVFTINVR